jgi:hypothetical protein
MTTPEKFLRALLAPDTGYGPVGARIRVTRTPGMIDIEAEVRQPIAALPQEDSPMMTPAVDVAVRVEGSPTREFHVAFYPRLARERPDLVFWNAPQPHLDPVTYTSAQRIVDDTHYAFSVRLPLALVGCPDGRTACRVFLSAFKNGASVLGFQAAGDGEPLPGAEGVDAFGRVEPTATFTLGRPDQLIKPRATSVLKSDAELGLDRLPAVRQTAPVTAGSERLTLDGDWRFQGAAAPTETCPEAWRTWPVIRVPGHHALQNFRLDPAQNTARWMREAAVPARFAGRRVLLRMDSVEGRAEVAVNGVAVAVVDNPYLPNEIDVTGALRPGEANLFSVTARPDGVLNAATGRARTSLFPDLTGRVWLEALPAAWLENLTCDTDAEGGLGLAWRVGGDTHELRLAARLLDADMNTVWETDTPAGAHALQTAVAAPRPWHPEHPYLYTLDLELRRDRDPVAGYRLAVGFRSVKTAPGQLLVNGKPFKVFGANHHAQQPLTGWWLREDEHRRDVERYRDANVNCLRVWPLNEAFLDACDRLGILVQMEVPISFFNFSGNAFNPESNTTRKRDPAVRDANTARTLRFLQQYRNHPCIGLWSVGNESDWDDVMEASARVVKRVDPRRPVLVSQDAGRGIGIPVMDIDTDHYPFHRHGQASAGALGRPILHTEWCHVSCRNVGELTADPGLHDRYVDPLRRVVDHTRDNTAGCVGGHLFTGVDVAAYAYPADYPVARDHVGCLGFIDRWRRPAPEWHHVWKCYAPVEIRDTRPRRRDGVLVFSKVENRSASAGLDRYRFTWATPRENGVLLPAANGEWHMPATDTDIELSCWDAAGRLVNRWRFPAVRDGIPAPEPAPAAPLRAVRERDGVSIDQGDLRWMLRPAELPYALRADGTRAVWDAARLVVTPGTEHPPSGLASGWKGGKVTLEQAGEEEVVVEIQGRYTEAEGSYRLRFLADGRIAVGYRFRWRLQRTLLREAGLAFRLPRGCDRLHWQRNAEWSWYPQDHIGRAEGATTPFPDPRALRAGPWDPPAWPWAHDATAAGCRDFTSTRRRLRRYVLSAPGGAGLTFEADGDRHARAWIDNDTIVAQCCHFTGRSAEGFLSCVDLETLDVAGNDILEAETRFRVR